MTTRSAARRYAWPTHAAPSANSCSIWALHDAPRFGLQANTTYYYRFCTGGVNSPIGRTKTLPVGDAGRVRMAVVSWQ